MTVLGETPLEWLWGQFSALLILVAISAAVAAVGIPIAMYKQRREARKAAPTTVWTPAAPPPAGEASSVADTPKVTGSKRSLSGWQRVFLILGLVYIVAAAVVALSGGKTEPGLYKGVSGDWCADRDGMFIDLRGTAGGYWDIYGKWHPTNTTTNCFITD